MFGLPTGGNQASPMYQNTKLHNGLLIAGAALIITGVALTCINHPAAIALGSVCLSLGVPILLMGIIMTCVRKSLDQQQGERHRRTSDQRSTTTPSRSGGQRLGSNSDARRERTERGEYTRPQDQRQGRRWYHFC